MIFLFAFILQASPSFAGDPFHSKDLTIASDAGGNVGVCNLGATLLTPSSGRPKASARRR